VERHALPTILRNMAAQACYDRSRQHHSAFNATGFLLGDAEGDSQADPSWIRRKVKVTSGVLGYSLTPQLTFADLRLLGVHSAEEE